MRASALEGKIDEFEVGRAAGPDDPDRQHALASAAAAKSTRTVCWHVHYRPPGSFSLRHEDQP